MTHNLTLEGWSIQPSGLFDFSFVYRPAVPLDYIKFDVDLSNSLDTPWELKQDSAMSDIPQAIKSSTCVKVAANGLKEASSGYGDAIGPAGKMAAGYTIPTNSIDEGDEILRILTEAFSPKNLPAPPESTDDPEAMARFEAVVVSALEKALAQVDAEEAKSRSNVPQPITPHLDYRKDAWVLGLSDAEAKRMLREGDMVYVTPSGRVRRAFLKTDIANGVAVNRQLWHGDRIGVRTLDDGNLRTCDTLYETELVYTYLHGNNLAG